MYCEKLDLEITESQCGFNSKRGHGYCKRCEHALEWGNERDKNKNHLRLVEEVFRDAIMIITRNERKVIRQMAYWSEQKEKTMPLHFKNSVRKLIDMGEEEIEANRWVENLDFRKKGLGWYAEVLNLNSNKLQSSIKRKARGMR